MSDARCAWAAYLSPNAISADFRAFALKQPETCLTARTAVCTATMIFLAAATLSVAPQVVTPPSAPATPTAEAYPLLADGDGSTRTYALSRWAEDWRRMRDPAKRDDVLDRLKFLPLDDDGDVYVTLSGEARVRVNHTTNPNQRNARAQRQDINRLVAGADVHIGPHFRAYGEVAHGGISGVELGVPAASLRNDVVVQQAFVEARGDVGGVALGLRYGRQEFTDGPNIAGVAA